MSKEEWAELCYLLAKLRYDIALDLCCVDSSNNEYIENQNKLIDEINDIMKIVRVDGNER